MIKTRLVGLLSHAKKYIVYTILWQWLALLSQVMAVFSIAGLLEKVVYGKVTAAGVQHTVLILILVVVIRFFCERMGARSSYLALLTESRFPPLRWCRFPRKAWSSWKPISENIFHSCFTA